MSKFDDDPVSPSHPLSAPPRAKPVLAWGIVRDGRLALIAFPGRPHEEMLLPGERVARVEIREIEEGQDDDQ